MNKFQSPTKAKKVIKDLKANQNVRQKMRTKQNAQNNSKSTYVLLAWKNLCASILKVVRQKLRGSFSSNASKLLFYLLNLN